MRKATFSLFFGKPLTVLFFRGLSWILMGVFSWRLFIAGSLSWVSSRNLETPSTCSYCFLGQYFSRAGPGSVSPWTSCFHFLFPLPGPLRVGTAVRTWVPLDRPASFMGTVGLTCMRQALSPLSALFVSPPRPFRWRYCCSRNGSVTWVQ